MFPSSSPFVTFLCVMQLNKIKWKKTGERIELTAKHLLISQQRPWYVGNRCPVHALMWDHNNVLWWRELSLMTNSATSFLLNIGISIYTPRMKCDLVFLTLFMAPRCSASSIIALLTRWYPDTREQMLQRKHIAMWLWSMRASHHIHCIIWWTTSG